MDIQGYLYQPLILSPYLHENKLLLTPTICCALILNFHFASSSDFHADNNDSTAEEETNDGQEEVKKSLSNEKDDGDEEDSTPLGEEDEVRNVCRKACNLLLLVWSQWLHLL